MRRSSRGFSAATVAILLVGALFVGSPADAGAVTGAGDATGTVELTPGVKLDGTCEEQTFTFSGVVLNGFFTDGTRHFAGQLSATNMIGKSDGPECGEHGSGTIGSKDSPGLFQGENATGKVSGEFYGTYHRDLGARVTADITVNLVLDGQAYKGLTLTLDAAAFVPTAIEPSEGRVVGASFVGEWRLE